MRCWLIYMPLRQRSRQRASATPLTYVPLLDRSVTVTADPLPLLPSHSIRQWKLPTPQTRPVRTRAHGVDRTMEILTDLPTGKYNVVPALEVFGVATDAVHLLYFLEVDASESWVAGDEHAPDVIFHSRVKLGRQLGLLCSLLRRLSFLDTVVSLHRVFKGGFGHCVGILGVDLARQARREMGSLERGLLCQLDIRGPVLRLIQANVYTDNEAEAQHISITVKAPLCSHTASGD